MARLARRTRLSGLVILARSSALVVAASACSPASAPTTPDLMAVPTTGEAFEGAQCTAIRPPTEPDLMGWDAGSRLHLSSNQSQGVVAVRYKAKGCNVELEVLDCIGEGTYDFQPYSATESKVARSTRDLYAELPIGAARLGSKVGGGRALRTDYMLTGVYRLASHDAFPTSKLRGTGCAEATHVVSKMYVGGFAMAAGVTEQLQAGASIFGVGAGGNQDRRAERVAAEGNAAACERAQSEGKPEPLCSVPLRVGLVPVVADAAETSLLDDAAARLDKERAPRTSGEAPAPAPGTPSQPASKPPPPVRMIQIPSGSVTLRFSEYEEHD